MKDLRVVGISAATALLFGGSIASAARLITGKDVQNGSLTGLDIKNGSLTGVDIKNSSLTGVDIKDGSLTGRDIKKGSIGLDRLNRATQALILASGSAGANGKDGKNGVDGKNGKDGKDGKDAPDPGVITPVNWISSGFSRWRDADNDSTITFATGGVTMGSDSGHRYGINLPVVQGTRLSDIGTLEYTGNAVLRVEVDPTGDSSVAPNYATFVYIPAGYKTATTGDVTHPLTEARWYSTRAIGTIPANGNADQTLADLLAATDADANVDNHARILNASLGGGSSTGRDPETVTVSTLAIGASGAPVSRYTFGN